MAHVEAEDEVMYWRRDPGGRSESVHAKVLEEIGNIAFIQRHDTGEQRWIEKKRLIVTKLAPIK
jgi:hypothetical protein